MLCMILLVMGVDPRHLQGFFCSFVFSLVRGVLAHLLGKRQVFRGPNEFILSARDGVQQVMQVPGRLVVILVIVELEGGQQAFEYKECIDLLEYLWPGWQTEVCAEPAQQFETKGMEGAHPEALCRL